MYRIDRVMQKIKKNETSVIHVIDDTDERRIKYQTPFGKVVVGEHRLKNWCENNSIPSRNWDSIPIYNPPSFGTGSPYRKQYGDDVIYKREVLCEFYSESVGRCILVYNGWCGFNHRFWVEAIPIEEIKKEIEKLETENA